MDQTKPWVQDLKIPIQDFQSWLTLKGTEESVTYWALKNGRISKPAYYAWAKNYFGLPALQNSYFQQPPNRPLWNKISSVANWSAKMLPLEEWDGVIFVGCVEPAEVSWSFPVVYILCEPEALQKLWDEYQVSEMSFTQIPPVPVDKAIADAAPVGLNLKLASPPPPPLPVAESVPPTHEVFFQDDIPTGVFEKPNLDGTAKVAAPSTPMAMPAFVPAEMVLDPNTAPVTIEEAADTQAAYAWFCKNAFVQYKHVFFLMYEGNMMKPHRFSNGLTPTSEAALQAIDPSKASVFRIVKRTNMPYHGPVVDSEMNKAFFTAWGFATYPAIVTCLPLLVGSETRGQILALGDENCGPQEILQLLERLTVKLFPALGAKTAA